MLAAVAMHPLFFPTLVLAIISVHHAMMDFTNILQIVPNLFNVTQSGHLLKHVQPHLSGMISSIDAIGYITLETVRIITSITQKNIFKNVKKKI